jgi:hypothetical protein
MSMWLVRRIEFAARGGVEVEGFRTRPSLARSSVVEVVVVAEGAWDILESMNRRISVEGSNGGRRRARPPPLLQPGDSRAYTPGVGRQAMLERTLLGGFYAL